jgi:hypothetical protein
LAVEIHEHPEGLKMLRGVAPELDAAFEVWGDCPVQGIGSICGRDLYFRARNDSWSLDVADSAGNLPSDGYRESDGFYREAAYPNASWMAHREAIKIIGACLQEYVAERAGLGSPRRASGK